MPDKYFLHWLERSRYDLETAKAMLDSRRYLYVAYMCQQAVEKLLKAMIVRLGKQNVSVHNLNRLAELAEVLKDLTHEHVDLLSELTAYNIEARYGDYRSSLLEIINADKAEIIYRRTMEFIEWLYRKIN